MIGVSEAQKRVQSISLERDTEEVPIKEASGRVLQEALQSDRDLPPFDRVMMDGIAIQYEQWQKGQQRFVVEGIQKAGGEPQKLGDKGHCLEVMTGAKRPDGTDTVIRYEDIDLQAMDGQTVAVINKGPKKKGQNVHPKGTNRPKGKLLVEEGTLLGSAEIAVAATVGKSTLRVARPPRVAVVSTGDELVGIDENPRPHQIRRSNVYAISAGLQELGIQSEPFHLEDDRQAILNRLGAILEDFEVVIMSGGVSKGKLDYIPDVLTECGVEKQFHKVRQRPGKPFWFGASEQAVVFALPGNPVSTFMCFYRYVQPWLQKQLGIGRELLRARLTEDFLFEKALTYFLQVRVRGTEQGLLEATPAKGKGSSDFVNLCRADGFLELPEQQSHFKAGQAYPLYLYRSL